MALAGLKVIEFAGLAPGPFAGLLLADNGASVTRIDRPSATSNDILCRGKRSIVVDSKKASGRKLLQEMISTADVVIDPFRPGVLERLGLGPDLFLGTGEKTGLNEKLIFARIVGFPRTGAHKDMAGHDINYLALSGALAMFPGKDKPTFPLNIVADFAGGGLLCAMGILLALIERGITQRGQIVNVDMVSGTRYLASFPLIHAFLQSGPLGGPRGTNLLDGGSPFYDTYTCEDGKWISVGCLEPQFFKVFIDKFTKAVPQDFDPFNGWKPDASTQFETENWPRLRQYLTGGFLTHSRDYWANLYHGTDGCVVPVLTPGEVAEQSGNIPLPHPRLAAHANLSAPVDSKKLVLQPGAHTREVLEEYGVNRERIKQLHDEGAFGEALRINSKL